jgi:hypothetical protein
MSSNADLGILASPIGAPSFGRCPKCGRWWTFKIIGTEKSPIAGTVSTYRCDRCGYEEQFAERHPPHAV